jgi:hypothetical protein
VPGVPGNLVINLTFDDFVGIPGLARTFYQTDINILNKGSRKRLKAIISLHEFQRLETLFRFLKLVRTPHSDGFYVLEKIPLPLAGKDIVEVELINIPQD